jgi:hypothetical protein
LWITGEIIHISHIFYENIPQDFHLYYNRYIRTLSEVFSMNVSDFMAMNVAQLRQALNISVLKSAQATAAAQATVMLKDFQQNQAAIQASAPHPYAGRFIDIRG